MSLTHKELETMCNRLAYKYNSPNHRDDLAQEGLLKCYEIIAEEPKAHPAKLHREAKRVMHDYLNLGLLPVYVPAHSVARGLAHDIDKGKSGTMGKQGHDWLKLVMSRNDIPYDEDFSESSMDQAKDYETKELLNYVISVADKSLSAIEYAIFKMRYFKGMSQDEVATQLEINKMLVSRHESRALNKIREAVL